jgi:hypothetical protein
MIVLDGLMQPLLTHLLTLALAWLAHVSTAAAFEMPTRDDFFDAQDGFVDVSRFLDRAYGFIPVLVPITEPAVGYGAAAALMFVNRRGEPGSEEYRRPNLAAIGALRTENGTRGPPSGGRDVGSTDGCRSTAASPTPTSTSISMPPEASRSATARARAAA